MGHGGIQLVRACQLITAGRAPRLHTLKSYNGDPIYHQFREGLEQLRKELLPHVLAIAASADYPLSSDIRAEAARLNATLQP